MPKYSIIVTNHNGLKDLTDCVQSIQAYTQDYELIIVDNGSTDGSFEYMNFLEANNENYKCLYNPKNTTFSIANNQGLAMVYYDSEYVVFLNNDTIVTPNWTDNIEKFFHKKNTGLDHVGAVGPVTNMSNGKQCVGQQNYADWYEKNKDQWDLAGILYGWCMMVKKSVLDEVGWFDEGFENGHEDNDLSLRIQLAGYKLVVAKDTYIVHKGQQTIKRIYKTTENYYKNGHKNRYYYYNKYKSNDTKKLVAVMRLGHGCESYIQEVLDHTAKFANAGIIVHLCRASDELKQIVESHKSVIKIGYYEDAFQEDLERDWLLQEALKMQADGKVDWCISVDGDELYEEKFIDKCQKMMNNPNPEVFGYFCNWRTIWRSEGEKEFYRTDSTFGQFMNYRFFKLIPNMKIISDHPEGHHCGSAPSIAQENLRWCNIRVKHLGYDTPEQRQKKYEFYQRNDHFKDPKDIGNSNYSHLIDNNVKLNEYNDNSVSCVMMVNNESQHMLACLESIESVVDEFVIVDNGSTDDTIDIINKFAFDSMVPIKIISNKWNDNFSIPRNLGKLNATKKWILYVDADEKINPQDLIQLFHLTENDGIDGYIFNVNNYIPSKVPNQQPNVVKTQTIRLFLNQPDIFFSGILHETVDDSISSLRAKRNVTLGSVGFDMHHYGYLKSKDALQKKFEYYETLNKRQIEVTGNTDPRPHYNMSLHYFENDEKDKGIVALKECTKINPKFPHANIQLASLHCEEMKKCLANVINVSDGSNPFRNKAIEIYKFLENNRFGNVKVCN